MKLELTNSQVAEVEPWLQRCRETWTPSCLIGQLMRGDWRDGPGTVWLHYCIIRPETALKIRKLIEKERTALANHS